MKKTLLSALFSAVFLCACGSPEAEVSYLHGNESGASQQYDNKEKRFPQNPETSVTPGALCQTPDEIRYPEKIKYCERHVAHETKVEVIQIYDKSFGYAVASMDRGEFKIDHFIPLCMGGSNDKENLWPQHKTVYEITDPFEPRLCDLMKAGRMKQVEALDLLKKVKFDLESADEVMAEVESRMGDK